jgi:hypothetical protein
VRVFIALLLPLLLPAQVAILQIQVVEGEGAVHAPGSRSVRPLTVAVTDETGKPVEHAAVSFHLPDDGPGGAFLSGLRTEVAVTDSTGRVSIRGVQWNHAPGRFQIRIVASREQARAGTMSFQYIGDSGGRTRPVPTATAPSSPSPTVRTASRGRTKWAVVVALLAAGATAGVVNGARSASAAKSTPTPPEPPTQLTIGTPSISLGKP